jgi:regulatory protein
MEAAAQLLAARSRSVAETRRRLRHLGYPEPLIEEVLTRLLAMGYLDDVAFGRAWVESRDRSRPRGEAALRQELRRQGLDDAVVREVLADRVASVRDGRAGDAVPAAAVGQQDAAPASVDRTAAERLLARKASALAREPDPRKRRQKAYALLARNGFDPGICQAVSRLVDAGPASLEDAVDTDALESDED